MEVKQFVERAASWTGCVREYYRDESLPTHLSSIQSLCFYGDIKHTFLLSSFLLKPYLELLNKKYLILCSWFGHHQLFPYVGEFWSVQNKEMQSNMASGSRGFRNDSEDYQRLHRKFIESMNMANMEDIESLYCHGFTDKYFNLCNGKLRLFLPSVASPNMLSSSFLASLESKRGKKVVIFPTKKFHCWFRGKLTHIPVPSQFWVVLIDSLLERGYVPVCYQNWFTYDMSHDFAQECIYLVPMYIGDVLAAINYVGLVADLFSGVSRFAIMARCPYVYIEERMCYYHEKEDEIDNLFMDKIPCRLAYTFSSVVSRGDASDWKSTIIELLLRKLDEMSSSNNQSNLGLSSIEEEWEPANRSVNKSKRGFVFFRRKIKNSLSEKF